jgi:hypothetical protein
MDQAIRQKYEIELRRLDEQFAELQNSWRHIPRYASFALIAPWLAYAYGFAAALVELLVTMALIGTSLYLTGVRKSENRWTRESLARELTQA